MLPCLIENNVTIVCCTDFDSRVRGADQTHAHILHAVALLLLSTNTYECLPKTPLLHAIYAKPSIFLDPSSEMAIDNLFLLLVRHIIRTLLLLPLLYALSASLLLLLLLDMPKTFLCLPTPHYMVESGMLRWPRIRGIYQC